MPVTVLSSLTHRCHCTLHHSRRAARTCYSSLLHRLFSQVDNHVMDRLLRKRAHDGVFDEVERDTDRVARCRVDGVADVQVGRHQRVHNVLHSGMCKFTHDVMQEHVSDA